MEARELRERREALGLSMNQLAGELEVSPATISRYEAGILPIRTPKMLNAALSEIEKRIRKRAKKNGKTNR